jgi:hypothetical protein
MIKFVSDLRQAGGFLRFPPPITGRHDITEILLKVPLNTITLTHLKMPSLGSMFVLTYIFILYKYYR